MSTEVAADGMAAIEDKNRTESTFIGTLIYTLTASLSGQWTGAGGVVLSSCPIASMIRRHTASPAQSPASAASSYRAFDVGFIAVAIQHQGGDAPDVDLRDHPRKAIRLGCIDG